jgi:hypothetical protein
VGCYVGLPIPVITCTFAHSPQQVKAKREDADTPGGWSGDEVDDSDEDDQDEDSFAGDSQDGSDGEEGAASKKLRPSKSAASCSTPAKQKSTGLVCQLCSKTEKDCCSFGSWPRLVRIFCVIPFFAGSSIELVISYGLRSLGDPLFMQLGRVGGSAREANV